MKIRSKALVAALAAGLVFGAGSLGTAQERETIDFDINAGKVTPSEDFAIMVSVLGAAITSRGNDVPVTVRLQIGDTAVDPWGNFASPSVSDVNDPYAPTRNHVVEQQFEVGDNSDPSDTEVTVTARSWVNGRVHIEANSAQQSQQVKVLRDGDPVPDISGFDGQADAVYFLGPYIDFDRGVMTLDKNQAIYLFEIGTTNVSSSAADFQDLVVLVTFGKRPQDFYEFTDLEALYD